MAKEKKSAPKEIKIVGIVEELELDEDDIGLRIVSTAHAYRVVMDKQGRKLLDYVDEEVEATGAVTKTKDGTEIKISHFRLVDEEEDEEDEDEAWPDGDDDDFMSDRYDD